MACPDVRPDGSGKGRGKSRPVHLYEAGGDLFGGCDVKNKCCPLGYISFPSSSSIYKKGEKGKRMHEQRNHIS